MTTKRDCANINIRKLNKRYVMKLTKPYFYDDFVCIASRCTDNCCIGWEIDIDERSLARYKSAEGEFAKRLCSAIHKGEGGVHTFAFGEGERCALLREDGLCELILNMGESSLCDICALHPRFFGWYNGLKEAGLGLCCEEVCRLMFADKEPLSFVSGEIDEEAEETCSEELLQLLLSAREELYSLLQDRSAPLRDRLYSAADYTRRLQDVLDNGGELLRPELVSAPETVADALNSLFSLYEQMESISAEWDERLMRLRERCADISEALPRFCSQFSGEFWRYEHIAVYFCYRYFVNGVFEGEVLSRIGLMNAAVLSVLMLDCLTWLEKGELCEWDRILNLKLYSKQVEYSEDNLALMYDAVWDNALLSPESLAAAFPVQI